MGKSVRTEEGDPFLLGLDKPTKNGQPKMKKSAEIQEVSADPFMLGIEVKKKETTSQDSPAISEQSTIASQNGTQTISPSELVFPSKKEERYKVIDNLDANTLLDDYKKTSKKKTEEVILNPFGGGRQFSDYAQSREGKVGKILSDIIQNGNFNSEDIGYLAKSAPKAAKQIVKAIMPAVEDNKLLDPETLNQFVSQGKRVSSNIITEQKIKNNQQLNARVKESLVTKGINPAKLQDEKFASDISTNILAEKSKELAELDKQYPQQRGIATAYGIPTYTRANADAYNAKKAEVENKYSELRNQIGLSKAYDFAQKNPTLTPKEIGEQWLKYADPDMYKLWQKAGKKGAIDRDIAEIGVRALYGTAQQGAVELAKGDEERLDYQFPDKIISETYHRLGAELYKDQNWFLNASPSVDALDKAAQRLPEKSRDIYYKFIREKERKNIGTEVPMSGLVNKAGEAIANTANETWKGLGDILHVRTDKKVAEEALNEGISTQFQDVGAYQPAVQKLKELDRKQKEKKPLTDQEIEEKQDLETFTGVRSTAQEIIDGTGNLTGQVLFQAVGTKGLGALVSGAAKGVGALKSANAVTGLATEEAIASQALNFGVSKAAINELSAAAVAYASSYDAAKRDAFRLMPDEKDAGKRTLYATLVGGLNAGTERIFKDEKVLNAFNKEISPSIKTLVGKLTDGKISQEALSTEISSILKNSAAFLKETGEANFKESAEELATSVGQSIATSILAPAKFNEQQAFNDAVSTFTTTFLHGGLTSSAAAIQGYRANHISVPTLSKLGVDEKLTSDTRNFINAQVLNGNMTQEEANGKFRILNTASKINREVMPQVDEVTRLPQKAREKYSVQLLNENILTAKAEESTDEVLKSELGRKVKESEKIRKQILNKELFVDDDYSVVSAEEINKKETGEELTPEEIVVRSAADDKLGVYSKMVVDDPKMAIEVLRDVAQQIYGVNDKGEALEGGSRKGGLSLQFSTDILEAAEKQFPTPESTLQTQKSDISQSKSQSNGNEKTSQESSQKSGEEGSSQETGSEDALRQQPEVVQEGAAETSDTETALLTKEAGRASYEDISSVFNITEKDPKNEFWKPSEKSATEVMDWLGKSEFSLPHEKELIEEYKKVVDPKLNIIFDTTMPMNRGGAAVFNKGKLESIQINPKATTIKGSTSDFTQVVLHEITHALTYDKSGNMSKELVDNLAPLYDIANNYINDNLESLKGTFNQHKITYGLSGINEFAAEAMANRDFQKILSSIPYKNTSQSVWQKVVEGVKNYFSKLLGTNNETLLNEIVNTITKDISKNNESSTAKTNAKPKVRVSAEQLQAAQPKTETKIDRKAISERLAALLGSNPGLAKSDRANKVSLEEVDIKPSDTITQVIDKLISFGGEFSDILNFLKGMPDISTVKFEKLASISNREGEYVPEANKAELPENRRTVRIGQADNAYYALVHEILHFHTLDSDQINKHADPKKLAALRTIYDFVANQKGTEAATSAQYGLTDFREFMVELSMNPELRKEISDVVATREDFKKAFNLRNPSPDGILDVIKDFIREIIGKIFNGSSYNDVIDHNKSLLDNAVDLATELFFAGQDVISSQKEGSVIPMSQQRGLANAALNNPALPSSDRNEKINDFVKSEIENGASVDDIKGALVDNGFTEQEALEIVNKVQKSETKSTRKKIEETLINIIGANSEDVLLDSVEHRRQVASDIYVEDTAKQDKLKLALVQEDANGYIQDMKDLYGKQYISKTLNSITGVNKNRVDLDKILAVGVALENEINNIKDGFTENEFNIPRSALNKAYASIQKINVENARISSKALNTVKTLYNNYENTVAKESILTSDQAAQKEAIMEAVLDEGKLSEAADAHETGVRLTEEAKQDVAKKDDRKPKKVTEKSKVKAKLTDILTDLKDKLNKLDC